MNYDMPMQAGDYVHRIGRTGRAHASGTAYTFVTAADEGMVHKIEAVLKQKIQRRRLEGIDYDTPALRMPDAEAIRRYVEANRHGGASRYATAH